MMYVKTSLGLADDRAVQPKVTAVGFQLIRDGDDRRTRYLLNVPELIPASTVAVTVGTTLGNIKRGMAHPLCVFVWVLHPGRLCCKARQSFYAEVAEGVTRQGEQRGREYHLQKIVVPYKCLLPYLLKDI